MEKKDEDILRAMVGKRADYYLAEFAKIEQGEKTSYDFRAQYDEPMALLYRRCNGLAIKYFLAPGILFLIGLFLSMDFEGIYPKISSFGGGMAFIGLIWFVASSIMMGKRFPRLYYAHLLKLKEQEHITDAEQDKATINRVAGNNWREQAIFIGCLVVYVIVLAEAPQVIERFALNEDMAKKQIVETLPRYFEGEFDSSIRALVDKYGDKDFNLAGSYFEIYMDHLVAHCADGGDANSTRQYLVENSRMELENLLAFRDSGKLTFTTEQSNLLRELEMDYRGLILTAANKESLNAIDFSNSDDAYTYTWYKEFIDGDENYYLEAVAMALELYQNKGYITQPTPSLGYENDYPSYAKLVSTPWKSTIGNTIWYFDEENVATAKLSATDFGESVLWKNADQWGYVYVEFNDNWAEDNIIHIGRYLQPTNGEAAWTYEERVGMYTIENDRLVIDYPDGETKEFIAVR